MHLGIRAWSSELSPRCLGQMIRLTVDLARYRIYYRHFSSKEKGKRPPGCLLAESVPSLTRFSVLLEPSIGTMPLSSTLSGLAHISDILSVVFTDNMSEMYPLKLTDFCLFLYHGSYTILQWLLIP